jgi:hypothetical protein
MEVKKLTRIHKQILRALLNKPSTFWQLIKKQDGHLPLYIKVLKEMIAKGFIKSEGDSICITDKGKEKAAELGLIPLQSLVCPACEGKSVTLQGKFKQVLQEFKEISKNRPPAISEYDQGYVDPVSTVSRVAVMYQRGDLEKQNIFLIGDDDLTSVAIALTGMANRITVLEVDDRLIEFINNIVKEYGWNNIIAVKYDVRNPIPEEYHGKYDVFLIDPVETLPGIKLFLSRSAMALQGTGSAGYFGLTHLEASRDKWHKIQKMILDMNFVITDIIHNFQEYELEREDFIKKDYPLVTEAINGLPVPDVNWYTSNFFRLEAIATPNVSKNETISLDRKFYFDNESYATLP